MKVCISCGRTEDQTEFVKTANICKPCSCTESLCEECKARFIREIIEENQELFDKLD